MKYLFAVLVAISMVACSNPVPTSTTPVAPVAQAPEQSGIVTAQEGFICPPPTDDSHCGICTYVINGPNAYTVYGWHTYKLALNKAWTESNEFPGNWSGPLLLNFSVQYLWLHTGNPTKVNLKVVNNSTGNTVCTAQKTIQ